MKLKNLAILLLCSAVLPAFSADIIEVEQGQHLPISGTSTNGSELLVGNYSDNNSLTISDTGTVSVAAGFIGQYFSNNSALVSGTNSSLRITDTLGIGNETGKNNSLVVEEGGWVAIGNPNGTANTISVGNTNGTASLSIGNGSSASADFLTVGTDTNENGSVTLTGGDTKLTIADSAYIGTIGSNNTVSISSGATMVVSNLLQVGSASTSNNVLNINNGGETVVLGSVNVQNPGDNQININNGGQLTYTGDVNLDETEENGLNFASGSTLEIGGTLEVGQMDSGVSVILNGSLSTNDAVWDTGTGKMYVGNTDQGNNVLTIRDGASAVAGGSAAIIGEQTNSNSIDVIGTNSTLTVNGQLLAGVTGDNNELSVSEGGRASISSDLRVGLTAPAGGNAVEISGTNSSLTVGGNAIIGEAGSNNSLTVTDATVEIGQSLYLGKDGANNRYTQTGGTNTVAGDFIIGDSEDATGKTGFVDGDRVETTGNLAIVEEGANLDIQQNLTVGREGGGSILTIRDGGTVDVAGDVTIGEAVGDNYIYLQRDADTRFNVTGDLIVGKEGGSNRFAVYGGTADIGGDLYLGSSTNQHTEKNFIHLETTNAVLNVANALHIGASNSVNTLDLVAGATVSAQDLFVGAFEGVSNNVVTITGDGSLLSVSNNLVIGSDSGSNNTVTVSNGGTLYAQQGHILLGSGPDSTLTIEDGGTLQTKDWNFVEMTGSATNIYFDGGSTLEVAGELSGTNQVEGGLGFTLSGTEALWSTGTNVLYVGNETGDNSLSITNGAMASTATNLYIGFTGARNSLTVGGTGSVLNVENDLYISNTELNTSGANNLFVLDGAQVSVGNDVFLSHEATLKIDSKSQVIVAGNYEQDQYSTLSVGISSNVAPPSLDVVGSAELAAGSTIEVYDDGIGDDTNVVQTIVRAGTLTIDGETATTGLLWDNIQTNLLLDFTITVSNNLDHSYAYIVLDNFIKRRLSDVAGLDGMLADVADEIEDMARNGDELAQESLKTLGGLDANGANKAMNDYYGEKGSSAPTHNIINQGIGGVASELVVRGDNSRERAAATPSGAAGPHTQGQELQGWVAGYGSWGNRSASDGYSAYDANLAGFIVGADLAVSKDILFGLAGGSNRGSADKDSGGTGDTKTTFFAAYGSAGTQDWFLDGSMIFGASKINQTLGTVFDTTSAYDAQNIAFYLGGGKEITGQYLIITPQASLLANYYEQDAYDEESSTAVARSVDSFDALYVQSSLGCSLGFYTVMGEMTLKPELRAHWLHEFNASEESLGYRLIGGNGTPYSMSLQAPTEDIIRLGAGVAAKMSDYLELRADLDTQQASGYSDLTLLGSLRYQF